MEFEAVIGLEVHAQLLTRTKIFCNTPAHYGADPNTLTCPVCMGLPGALPVLNQNAVDMALRLAVAVGCDIRVRSQFARKNYFYPDLPKGYQISQYDQPLAENGYLDIAVDGEYKRVAIRRIHMEEDAGKSIHVEGKPLSQVDFNRTGVPLVEIVSEPDLRSPDEAVEYLKELRTLVRWLGVSDGNMEEGTFRCDANVSVRPKGSSELGVKTELKNMNTFRGVHRALAYEIERQAEILRKNGEVAAETRLWNDAKGITVAMRSKEEANDYRYFPDPDLPPLVLQPEQVEQVKSELPELPAARRRRFTEQYALPGYDARVLNSDRELANYFESTVEAGAPPKAASNWIMTELLRALKGKGGEEKSLSDCPVTPKNLADLIKLIDSGAISGSIAKQVFEEMFRTGATPAAIVKERKLEQVSDEAALAGTVAKVLAAHPAEAERLRTGEQKLNGFFMGQIMRETQGRANPKLIQKLLREIIG